jgi:hypothetical protein
VWTTLALLLMVCTWSLQASYLFDGQMFEGRCIGLPLTPKTKMVCQWQVMELELVQISL